MTVHGHRTRLLAALLLACFLAVFLAVPASASDGVLSAYPDGGTIRVSGIGAIPEGTFLSAGFLSREDLPAIFGGAGEPVLAFRAEAGGVSSGTVDMVPPESLSLPESWTLYAFSGGQWEKVPSEPVTMGLPGGLVRTGLRARNAPLGVFFVAAGGGDIVPASDDGSHDRYDETRYLNQNFWYQNRNVTVWWAGFSDYKSEVGGTPDRPTELNYLVPAEGDAHVRSVSMTHYADGRKDGRTFAVPEGDGTDAAAGDAPRLYDIYPAAAAGSGTDYENTFPAMHDYLPSGEDGATHLVASWKINGMEVLSSGLVPKGTHNWDAARENSGYLWTRSGTGITTAWIPDFITPEIIYYRAVLPSSPKTGHDFALLEIVPETGYYVRDAVITCCFHGDAYRNCSVYNTGNAFQDAFGEDGSGAGVSLVVDSENFCHGNNQDGSLRRYYVMVRTEPIPGSIYAEYLPGTVADSVSVPEDWLEGSRKTESGKIRALGPVSDEIGPGEPWTAEDLSYTVDRPSEDVLSAAQAEGLSFAGWSLDYFPEAQVAEDKVSIVFSGGSLGGASAGAGETVSLRSHARLTALWTEEPKEEPAFMPETGGRGTAGIYAAGAMGLVPALALLLAGPGRKKKKDR